MEGLPNEIQRLILNNLEIRELAHIRSASKKYYCYTYERLIRFGNPKYSFISYELNARILSAKRSLEYNSWLGGKDDPRYRTRCSRVRIRCLRYLLRAFQCIRKGKGQVYLPYNNGFLNTCDNPRYNPMTKLCEVYNVPYQFKLEGRRLTLNIG